MTDSKMVEFIYKNLNRLRGNFYFNQARKLFVFVLAFKDIFISWNHKSLI